MANWRATIFTSWTQDANNANVPALLQFLQPGDSAVDVTGGDALNITPTPNAVVWEFTGAKETLDTIAADGDHFVLESSEVLDDG